MLFKAYIHKDLRNIRGFGKAPHESNSLSAQQQSLEAWRPNNFPTVHFAGNNTTKNSSHYKREKY